MGIFDKIKKNFNHGGVNVSLQAPASISSEDATMPVNVLVANGPDPQNITKVYIEIRAYSNNASFGSTNNSSSTSEQMHVVARAESVQGLSLQPGQSVTVPLTVTINEAQAFADQLPENGFVAQAAVALQKFQSLSDALNSGSYRYELHAGADVEGIALDPSTSQQIQILKPGQFGGAINI